MLNKWKDVTQDNKVKLITFILGVILIPVVGFYGKAWIKSSSELSKPASIINTVSHSGVLQTNQSGQNIVHSGSGTIKKFMVLRNSWC